METPIEIDHLVRLAYEHAPTDTLALFEYRIGIDFADEIDVSNRAALAVLFNGTRMLGWRPGFQVRHDFEDIAGEVSFAINREILPFVAIDVALALNYGSQFLESTVQEIDDVHALSLILLLRLSSDLN
jgi:hypothetical protein